MKSVMSLIGAKQTLAMSAFRGEADISGDYPTSPNDPKRTCRPRPSRLRRFLGPKGLAALTRSAEPSELAAAGARQVESRRARNGSPKASAGSARNLIPTKFRPNRRIRL
jgi:hypothetical protein